MRKLIVLIFIIGGSFGLKAQTAVPTFTVTPSEIDALTENVSIVFDVTGSAVDGLTDVYIWAWAPGLTPSEALICYEGGSASWGSISPNAKLEPVAGNPQKFKLTFPKTVTRGGAEITFKNMAELFGVGDSPGKIKSFGFLLRSQDGSKQTPGDNATQVKLLPLEFNASYFRTFPSKVSNKDVTTVYLDLKMLESGEDNKLLVSDNMTAGVSLLDAAGVVLVTAADLPTTLTAEGEHAFTFLPAILGAFPAGKSVNDVKKCQVIYSGMIKTNGSDAVVKTKTFEFDFQPYE